MKKNIGHKLMFNDVLLTFLIQELCSYSFILEMVAPKIYELNIK